MRLVGSPGYAPRMHVSATPGGGRRIEFRPTPPGIYLDHGVMGQIAEDPRHSERFIARLHAGGTLVLSSLHMIEMAVQGPGRSMDDLERLLRAVGHRFMVIDPNVDAVAARASECGDETGATFDFDFALVLALESGGAIGPWSLHQVCGIGSALQEQLRPQLQSSREEAASQFEDARRAVVDGHTRLPPLRGDEAACVQISRRLAHSALRDSAGVTPNDMFDLLHAAVPLAVSHFVLLDKKWADRARRVQRPPRLAEVFSGKKGQIEAFLDAFERWTGPGPGK
ncbi:MAG: hypothetical protein HMLKMBBP_02108 [Planctomycetes bacterium]|nr:hypothetical protein [Planctomycetota bacterium]